MGTVKGVGASGKPKTGEVLKTSDMLWESGMGTEVVPCVWAATRDWPHGRCVV